MRAAYYGMDDIICILINRGAELNLKNDVRRSIVIILQYYTVHCNM
jgi:hypothetical protein